MVPPLIFKEFEQSKAKMEVFLQPQEEESQKEEERRKDLPPWEQHATVINMPRFDYQAPSALLQSSHSGFLITCTMKREKSATKEAIDILQKCLDLSTCASRDTVGFMDTCQNLKNSETDIIHEIIGEQAVDTVENTNSKRRRMSANMEEFASCNTVASNAQYDSVSKIHCPALGISSVYEPNSLTERDQYGDQASSETGESPGAKINSGDALLTGTFTGKYFMPSLVKLARNGILFFSLPGNHFSNIVGVLAKVFQALSSGEIKPPEWCHRILPVQATCLLKEDDLRNVVLKLVKEHIGNTETIAEKPLKFAVGYNTRGMEGKEVSSSKSQKNPVHESSILGRNECFRTVAGAVKEVVTHSAVDLRSPEMAVLIEVLPLSGVCRSCVAAVSVLPGDLVNAKPRLCVKPLISEMTSNKKIQS